MDAKGRQYFYGTGGVPKKDDQQAFSWFRKAAEAGDPAGMNDLGDMYLNGIGVEKDYAQAFSWFRKAAEAGNPDGMVDLGFMYENGYGVQRDQQQAI